MSNTDLTKYRRWTQVLRKGKQFLMVPTQCVPITTLTCEFDWCLYVVRHTLYTLVLFVMFSTHHHFDMWIWLTPLCGEAYSVQTGVICNVLHPSPLWHVSLTDTCDEAYSVQTGVICNVLQLLWFTLRNKMDIAKI
jgi:hypothetical protein